MILTLSESQCSFCLPTEVGFINIDTALRCAPYAEGFILYSTDVVSVLNIERLSLESLAPPLL